MNTLDIAKEYLCTAEQTRKEAQDSEKVFRQIFSCISSNIDAAVRCHMFDITIEFNWDIEYIDNVIDTLNILGYHAELTSNHKHNSLYIKW